MENRLKLYILGHNRSLLNEVLAKINSTRPVDAVLFTDLKEYLATAMSSPPDLFAISVDFPHPKTTKFPKVLKMAMNIPVLVFGETNEAKTRKAASLCQADYKISGKINAHNLWMKILNFQRDEIENENKQNEKEQKAARRKSAAKAKEANPMASLLKQLGSDQQEDSSGPSYQHIKPSGDSLTEKPQASFMSSDSGVASQQSGKNTVHVKSSDSNPLQGGSEESRKPPSFSQMGQEKNQGHYNPQDSQHRGSSVENKSSFQHLKASLANHQDEDNSSFVPSELDRRLDPSSFNKNQASKKKAGESQEGGDNQNISSGNSFNPNELSSLLNGGFFNPNNTSAGKDSKLGNHIKSSPMAESDSADFSPQEGKEQDSVDSAMAEMRKNKKDSNEQAGEEKSGPETSFAPSELDRRLNPSSLNNNQAPKKKPQENEKEQGLKKNNPLQKEESKKKKTKQIENNQSKKDDKIKNEKEGNVENKISILKDACNIALPEAFEVHPLDEPRPFDIENMAVFSINQPSFKGYIIFANSFNNKEDRSQMDDMKSKICEHLDGEGLTGGIGNFFEFNVPSVEYLSWAEETCDFTIKYEDDAGKQFFVSFLPREKVVPTYSDADKNCEMIRVDLQHIPPNTPVDFDAFIHLPLNKRYVRYLKKERSIGLDQAKRLLKDSEHKRLYVPKSEKQKFIQFYIKNAIYWEIMAFKKQNAA